MVGEHERQLDPKGRVALPSDFRARFEPQCYLTMGENQCVAVMAAADFEAEMDELMAAQRRGEVSRNVVRTKFANAHAVKVDGQGRINVPEKLRTYAELAADSPVLVNGAGDRLEIWQPGRFARIDSAGSFEIAGTNEGASV